MCNYCNVPIYLKIKQYTKPILAPLTEEQALRDRLSDLTGELYVELPKIYCPVCGAKIREVAADE